MNASRASFCFFFLQLSIHAIRPKIDKPHEWSSRSCNEVCSRKKVRELRIVRSVRRPCDAFYLNLLQIDIKCYFFRFIQSNNSSREYEQQWQWQRTHSDRLAWHEHGQPSGNLWLCTANRHHQRWIEQKPDDWTTEQSVATGLEHFIQTTMQGRERSEGRGLSCRHLSHGHCMFEANLLQATARSRSCLGHQHLAWLGSCSLGLAMYVSLCIECESVARQPVCVCVCGVREAGCLPADPRPTIDKHLGVALLGYVSADYFATYKFQQYMAQTLVTSIRWPQTVSVCVSLCV